jgi:hypothetical protein
MNVIIPCDMGFDHTLEYNVKAWEETGDLPESLRPVGD